MEQLKHTVADVVRRATARGATAADAMIREDDTFSVTVRMNEVDTLKEAISRGLLLRLFVRRRMATSFTSDLSRPVLEQLVDETLEMATITSEDESGGLPDSDLFRTKFPELDLLDSEWETLRPEDRIEMARTAERSALALDPKIVNSDGASFDYTRTKTVLANTLGFVGGFESTVSSLAVVPIAQSKSGMQRDYWMSMARHRKNLEMPESIGRKAAERALRRLDARKGPTCEAPVVFDPMTARSLLGHVFQAVSGDAIYRRSSFLVDRIGTAVAAERVTIVDDALLPGGIGSSPFDDEGIPCRTNVIVENGVLCNYLHTSYTARKLGARPTGNGTRAMSGAVTVGPANFYLKPGPYNPDEIIGSVESGLYVVELIGFGVNQVSGDYSRGATGIWIQNGRLAYPVQEVTIAGNLNDMLKGIEMIGSDLTFLGPIAAPTVKIRKMVVSGT